MIPYFLNLAYILIDLTIGKYQFRYFFRFAFCIFIIFFVSFRIGGTGLSDYDIYLRLYEQFSEFDRVTNPYSHVEIGFRVSCYILNLLNLPPQSIILWMGTLSTVPVLIIINRYSKQFVVSLILWFPFILTMNMQSSRISVAAAFGLLFFEAFLNRKYARSLIYMSLAVTFHSSAIILVLAILTMLRRQVFLIATVFFWLILIFIGPFDLMEHLFASLHMTRYVNFLNIYRYSELYGYPMSIYDIRLVTYSCLTLMTIFIIKRLDRESDEYFCKLFIIGFCILTAFSESTALALRGSYYFLITSIICIPKVATQLDRYYIVLSKTNNFFSLAVLAVFFLYSSALIIKSLPYDSLLSLIF